MIYKSNKNGINFFLKKKHAKLIMKFTFILKITSAML